MKTFVLLLASLLICSGTALAENSVYLYAAYGQNATSIEKFITAEDYRGVTLAVEKINNGGGLLGRNIKIIDGKVSTLIAAKKLAIQQVQKGNVVGVIGSNTSSQSMVIAPLFQDAGIPMIATIATGIDVTGVGDYVFRVCFIDPFQGKLMADFALETLGAKTAVILKKPQSKYSVSLAHFFKNSFQEQGKIVWEATYNPSEIDHSKTLLKIKELNPDVVFIPGHGQDSGIIVKQAHALKLQSKLLGGDGWGKGTLKIAGSEAAEGNYFTNHWHPLVVSEKSKEFVEEYSEMYGERLIASSAALAYDAVFMFAEAVIRAGTFEGQVVRDELAKTVDFEGVTGIITLDEMRNPVLKGGVIMQYRNGKIEFVQSVTPGL